MIGIAAFATLFGASLCWNTELTSPLVSIQVGLAKTSDCYVFDWPELKQTDLSRLSKIGAIYDASSDSSYFPVTLQSSIPESCQGAVLIGDSLLARQDDLIAKLPENGMVYITRLLQNQPLLFKRDGPQTNLSIPFSKRSIFQKYVFFNAPIFMGIFSMFFVVLIALIGVQMIASLQTPTKFMDPHRK